MVIAIKIDNFYVVKQIWCLYVECGEKLLDGVVSDKHQTLQCYRFLKNKKLHIFLFLWFVLCIDIIIPMGPQH